MIGGGICALGAKLVKSDPKSAAKKCAVIGMVAGAIKGYNSGVDSYQRQCKAYQEAKQKGQEIAFASLAKGNEQSGEIILAPDASYFYAGTANMTPLGINYFKGLSAQYTDQAQIDRYENSVRNSANAKYNTNASADYKDDMQSYSATAEDKNKVLATSRNYKIVITAHTDDRQDASAAQTLSEQRAKAVAEIFRAQGVNEDKLLYQGAGASYPIADNKTDQGKQKNNRVEVVLLFDEKVLLEYVDARQARPDFFSERESSAAAPAAVAPEKAISKAPGNAPATSANNTSTAKPTTTRPAATSQPTTQASNSQRRPQPQSTVPANPNTSAKNSAASQTQNNPTIVATAKPNVGPGINLQGASVAAADTSLLTKLGTVRPPSTGFSLDSLTSLVGIGNAYASNPLVATCNLDDPGRYKVGDIKRLNAGASFAKTKAPIESTDSYLNNTVRAPFYGSAGDYTVLLKNVTIKASGEIVEQPEFNLIPKEGPNGSAGKEKIIIMPVSQAWRGEGGVLVRNFFVGKKDVVCMDMLIPNNRAAKTLPDTALYHNEMGVRKVATLNLER